MATTANRSSRGVSVTWGLSRLGNCASTLTWLSIPGTQRPGPGRPKTYDGKVHWDDQSRFEQVKRTMTISCSIIRSSITCNPSVTSAWCSWSTPNTTGGPCSWHRCRLGRADDLPLLQGALPNRVSVQRRQTVYRFDRLPSPLTSQAQLSLQCQSECGYAGQAGCSSAQWGRSVSIFHGEPQAARLQSTSDRANFSAFSPGAQLGKIQSRL